MLMYVILHRKTFVLQTKRRIIMENSDFREITAIPRNKPEGKFNANGNQVTIGKKTYTMREVTEQELKILRKKRIPSLVVKIQGKLLHTCIDPQKPVTYAPCHMCNDQSHDCSHLLAKNPVEGGCFKVIERSRFIERFDFISEGYETFGTIKDSLIVIKCSNYEKSPARAKKDIVKEYIRDFDF